MNKPKELVLVAISLIFLSAFAGKKQHEGTSPSQDTPATTSVKTSSGDESVWVQRPDGSKSCEAGSGTTTEKGGEELQKAGVQVLEKGKGDDGRMHAQMCGIETGKLNTYRIKKADLPKALALGYQQKK